MPIEHTPSLFPDEWYACYGTELQQLLAAVPEGDSDATQAQFLQTHPPIFEGVYLSPTIELGTTLGRPPRLTWQNDQLWITLWSDQDAELVLHAIPIAYHHLVALVLRHELVIIRAEDYENAEREHRRPNTERGDRTLTEECRR